MQDFIEKIARMHDFIENDVPDIVGKEAVDHFKESFDNEGFTNERQGKWKEVKRRENSRNEGRASGNRKILTGETKELAESIQYDTQGNNVIISSDKVYAEIHNKGGRAGRGHKSVIPKRQFIGPSEKLNQKITTKITTKLDKI